jgi:Type I restriction enzyme R protein N terminus (HSDR_N)
VERRNSLPASAQTPRSFRLLARSEQLNLNAAEQNKANRFSVTRQLRYSRDETQRALDVCLFINGMPVATFELKNSLTKQTVADAVEQYQRDRDPREKLFEFGRCVVHFAVDCSISHGGHRGGLTSDSAIFLDIMPDRSYQGRLLMGGASGIHSEGNLAGGGLQRQARTGIPSASRRAFRHSFESHLLQANYDILTIQRLESLKREFLFVSASLVKFAWASCSYYASKELSYSP